ncbi:MAG TPA: TonB family protein [Thermoanaerobaculia bacterium]|jgi:protein TonB|nr:TonB family protein [Thermoanaerobaculia bacterium]
MFEHSLVVSQRQSQTRVIIVSAALTIHAVGLAGVAVAQYWTIDPVAEPAIRVSFIAAPDPPPPPPAGPPPAPEPSGAVPPQPVEIATTPVQPVAIPDQIPEAPDQPLPSSVPGGLLDGIPNGVPNGVRDGVPGGSSLGIPGGTVGSDGVAGEGVIHHVRGDVVKPVILERVQPTYTEIARRARIQGIVIVETIIDTQGRVTDARVLKPLPMGLSESAVDAVKQWRFKPATLDQRPVSVYFTLTVKFELQ